MDVRGHGASAKPHDPEAYGPEVLRDIARLMDHLGLEKANLIGYSMGGEIALAFLTAYPERVIRAVVGGGGWVEVGDPKHELWQTDAALLASLEPGGSIAEQLFPGTVFDAPTTRTFDANDARALSAAAHGMLHLALEEQALRQNEVSTLLLVGEIDHLKFSADKALAVGSNIRMHVLAGQDHLSAISDPKFARVIREFLMADR